VVLLTPWSIRFDPHDKVKCKLDKYSHPAEIQSVLPPLSKTLGIYPSGGFYEKGSPEVANSKKFQ
jgi:hypothetical protein